MVKALHRANKPLSKYKLFFSFAIDGYKVLRLYSLKTVETRKMQMTTINTVDLPGDYLEFVSVGVPFKAKLWTFTRDNKLIVTTTDDCGEETLDESKGEGVEVNDNQNVSSYGIKGGRNDYYFTLDEKNSRLILNGFNRTEVILKYISTGINISDVTWIPRIAEEALIAWIHWKEIENNDEAPENKVMRRERRFKEELDVLSFLQGPSIEEIMDMIYSTFRQGVKR